MLILKVVIGIFIFFFHIIIINLRLFHFLRKYLTILCWILNLKNDALSVYENNNVVYIIIILS